MSLESVSGWKTNGIKPPVLILCNFKGYEKTVIILLSLAKTSKLPFNIP